MSDKQAKYLAAAEEYVRVVSNICGDDEPTALRAVARKALDVALGSRARGVQNVMKDMRVQAYHMEAALFRTDRLESPIMEGAFDALGIMEGITQFQRGLVSFHGWPEHLDQSQFPPELLLSEMDRRAKSLRVSLSRNGGCHTMRVIYTLRDVSGLHTWEARLTVWTWPAWMETKEAREKELEALRAGRGGSQVIAALEADLGAPGPTD